jgi:hypothetical protein
MSSLHPFVAETLRNLHFTPEEAAREFAVDRIKEKIRIFESEIIAFETKYGISFENFSMRMEARQNEEIFEESDDWNDWRSSIELSISYQRELEKLNNLAELEPA